MRSDGDGDGARCAGDGAGAGRAALARAALARAALAMAMAPALRHGWTVADADAAADRVRGVFLTLWKFPQFLPSGNRTGIGMLDSQEEKKVLVSSSDTSTTRAGTSVVGAATSMAPAMEESSTSMSWISYMFPLLIVFLALGLVARSSPISPHAIQHSEGNPDLEAGQPTIYPNPELERLQAPVLSPVAHSQADMPPCSRYAYCLL